MYNVVSSTGVVGALGWLARPEFLFALTIACVLFNLLEVNAKKCR